MAFERDFYPVNEGDSVVNLTVIATGAATIDSPVSVRVFTRNLSPPSAIGMYVHMQAAHTHTHTHTHTNTHTHTHHTHLPCPTIAYVYSMEM